LLPCLVLIQSSGGALLVAALSGVNSVCILYDIFISCTHRRHFSPRSWTLPVEGLRCRYGTLLDRSAFTPSDRYITETATVPS